MTAFDWAGFGDFVEHLGIAIAATVGAVVSVRTARKTKRLDEQVNGREHDDG